MNNSIVKQAISKIKLELLAIDILLDRGQLDVQVLEEQGAETLAGNKTEQALMALVSEKGETKASFANYGTVIEKEELEAAVVKAIALALTGKIQLQIAKEKAQSAVFSTQDTIFRNSKLVKIIEAKE